MKKILVISDTHGEYWRVINLLSNNAHGFDMVFHLGDCIQDLGKLQEKFPQIPMVGVKGNCDYSHSVKTEEYVTIENVNFLLTHGHRFNVKSTMEDLKKNMDMNNVDITLYGHTHIPKIIPYGKKIIMNPGSVERNRNGSRQTFGIVEIGHGGEFRVIVEFF